MTNDRPTTLIDPVCGMTGDVESAERAAAAQPPVDAGICEVAEAEVARSQ